MQPIMTHVPREVADALGLFLNGPLSVHDGFINPSFRPVVVQVVVGLTWVVVVFVTAVR